MFVGGSPPELTMTGFRSECLSVIKPFTRSQKDFMTETKPKMYSFIIYISSHLRFSDLSDDLLFLFWLSFRLFVVFLVLLPACHEPDSISAPTTNMTHLLWPQSTSKRRRWIRIWCLIVSHNLRHRAMNLNTSRQIFL